MAELILTNVDDVVLHHLQERAAKHARTSAEEARAILEEALREKLPADWAPVDAIYRRLAASGQSFSDSADLLRKDRER